MRNAPVGDFTATHPIDRSQLHDVVFPKLIASEIRYTLSEYVLYLKKAIYIVHLNLAKYSILFLFFFQT